MISALSGNGSLALLSLFGRPKSQNTADQNSLLPAAPAGEGKQGSTSESVFAALVDQTGAPGDLSSQAISALDRDGSGSLTSVELLQAYQAVAGAGSTSAVAGLVAQIMAQVDGDGDGALSANELTSAVRGLSAAASGVADGDAAAALRAQLMAGLDGDGDGAISSSEAGAALGQPGGTPAGAFGIADRPETGPRSLYEAIFSLRVNPESGDQTATAREALAQRLKDTFMR